MICHPGVKVNLGLNVLRKREDGFHDLETLFVPYPGIHDTLEIIAGDDFSLTSASLFSRYSAEAELSGDNPITFRCAPSLPAGAGPLPLTKPRVATGFGQSPDNSPAREEESTDNPAIRQAIREDGKLMITIARAEGVDWDPLKDLTAKAYGILDADFKLPPVKIFLEKTSPVGAGLGGGSADAAIALRMISELFSLGLSDAQLAAYAARLGSDCAFFVYDQPMIGEGRGEVLTPFADLDFRIEDGKVLIGDYELRVIVPQGIAVSTKEAYSGIVPRERSEEKLLPLREALALPVEQWRDSLVNDFEKTVFIAHPELPAIKQRLYDEGAVYASMSGSGSALFALYSTSSQN